MSWKIIFGVVGLAIILLFGWWPTEYRRVIREGMDSYETHYPLFGERSRKVELEAREKVTGVGLLLVNLRRVEELPDTEVVIRQDRRVVGQAVISGDQVQDDQFAWADFGSVSLMAGQVGEVEVTARQASNLSAVGWRYEEGTGLGAIAAVEQVPAWKQVRFWAGKNREAAERLVWMLIGGVIGALVLAGFEKWSKWGRISSWAVGIGILMGITIWIRWPLIGQVESAFGGDIFNYLLKSRAWLEGGDPLAADFRKAPLMSLLLLPGFWPGFDQVIWGRVISTVAAAVSVGLVVGLARELKVPRSLALGAGLLLAVNREFRWESVHGLANSLFAMLVLWAVFIFVRYRERLSEYRLAVVGSLALLTRYEGGIVLASLMPWMWWYKKDWVKAARSLIPIIILVGSLFVMWPLSGEVGVRTPDDLAGDGGLYLVTTSEEWQGNLKAARLFMGRLWLLREFVGNQHLWLLGGLVIGGIWGRVKKPPWLGSVILSVLIVLLLGVVVRGSEEVFKLLSLGVTGVTGFGIGAMLVKQGRQMGPVWLMAWLLWLAVTLILPKTRYYLWLVPLLAVAIVYGVWVMGGKKAKVVAMGLVGLWVSLVYVESGEALPGQLSDYNEKSASQTVILEAARWLDDREGRVAVVSEQDVPLRVYLGEDRTFVVAADANLKSLIDGRQVDYVLETTAVPYEYPVDEQLELVEVFDTEYADPEARLYRVD